MQLTAKPFQAIGQVRASRAGRLCRLVVRAEATDRRALLSGLAAAAATLQTLARPQDALAAYGDSANVFGRTTNKTGFVPYAGEGFAVLLPSKWNPSKEREFPNMVLRYEDNFDTVTNFCVIAQPTNATSVEDLGSQEKFLESVSYLLGKQSFSGETLSEGGFQPGRVSAASLLDQSVTKDKKGKTFYTYEILTRTADGDEGGKHQLIKATVSNGKLWILKITAGDKRWFKGAKKDCQGVLDSFTVA